MNVLLNIEILKPPIAGTGNYVLHLAQGLKQHPDITSLRCYSISLLGRITTPELELPKNSLPRPLLGMLRHLPYIRELRRRISDISFRHSNIVDKTNIYHGPNFTLHPYDGPCVVTIPDLSHVHFPQHHPKSRVISLERDLKRTLKQATKVISISEFVRQELIDMMGLSPEKVHTVHLGVDENYHPRSYVELQPTLERYNLDGTRYLLSVCTLEPRKNLIGLVAGFSRLPEKVRRQHPLVVVGASGWMTGAIEKALAPLERDGQVRRLGYVDAADLPLLYAGAHAFAYPSFYEGFGLPPLEAMASGVPVLASDRASIPEVVGDAALLVNPDNVDDIAAGLERLLTDQPFRENAAKTGLTRASQFSWTNCVEQTVDVYRQAIA